jgi:hypothetical protein
MLNALIRTVPGTICSGPYNRIRIDVDVYGVPAGRYAGTVCRFKWTLGWSRRRDAGIF